jgi:hypothetical protein
MKKPFNRAFPPAQKIKAPIKSFRYTIDNDITSCIFHETKLPAGSDNPMAARYRNYNSFYKIFCNFNLNLITPLNHRYKQDKLPRIIISLLFLTWAFWQLNLAKEPFFRYFFYPFFIFMHILIMLKIIFNIKTWGK